MMHRRKRARLTIACVAVSLAASAAQADTLAPALQETFQVTPASETISTLVYLAKQADTGTLSALADEGRLTMTARHELVVRSMQSLATSSQARLLAHLQAGQNAGAVARFQPYWVANVVRVDAEPAFIEALADRLDVGQIYPNYQITLVAPVSAREKDAGCGPRSVEPGVQAVRAPEVWALGITGAGVLVANIDTGVDGSHPALADRWAGTLPQYDGHPEWAWFDPYGYNNTFPFDDSGHGTHTMGTVVGGAPGEEIGVAPGARWIAAGAINRGGGIGQTVADALEAFEWLIDPDGDPGTNWDVPAVCSNSWGLATVHGYPPCDVTFWGFLDACEAAGIAIVFTGGGDGPGPGSIVRPADRATTEYRTLAVGAIDPHHPDWPVASFSSRGPSYCTPDGSAAIKPDIAGPGVNILSSIPGGSYSYYSGASMAPPHVAGVMALMREANPELTPQQMMQLIYDTAHDLGEAGKDNSYGYGMVDAYEAVRAALDMIVCVGDVDGDGDTDQADLGQLLASYGVDGGGDLDGDGDTDQADLGVLLADYDCGV